MSDCHFGVSPVNYPDPESVFIFGKSFLTFDADFKQLGYKTKTFLIFQENNYFPSLLFFFY